MRTSRSRRAGNGTAPVPTFDLSVAIRRPPATVFALLADIQDAEPIPRSAGVRMVKEPSGPTTTGTRWHEWVRLAPGCWSYVESVVTDVRPPYLLAMDFRSRWLTGHLDYLVEPAAAGCVLHQREWVRLPPLLRWSGRLLERSMRPHLVERLADIKTILEAEP